MVSLRMIAGCLFKCNLLITYFQRWNNSLGILAHLLKIVLEPKYFAFRRCLDTPCSSAENMTQWLDAVGLIVFRKGTPTVEASGGSQMEQEIPLRFSTSKKGFRWAGLANHRWFNHHFPPSFQALFFVLPIIIANPYPKILQSYLVSV